MYPLLGLEFKAMLHCMLKLYNLMRSATQPSRTPVRFQSHPMDTTYRDENGAEMDGKN
jgi:hypothetical protein